jgi:aspartate aminotransferase
VQDSLSFCTALLQQAHVNLVPGVAFGAEGYVRMSFATSQDVITAGLARFQEWLQTAQEK